MDGIFFWPSLTSFFDKTFYGSQVNTADRGVFDFKKLPRLFFGFNAYVTPNTASLTPFKCVHLKAVSKLLAFLKGVHFSRLLVGEH